MSEAERIANQIEMIVADYAEGIHESPEALLITISQLLGILNRYSSEIDPVVEDYRSAMRKYLDWEVRTMDEAFDNVDARKGGHIEPRNLRQTKGYDIYLAVEKLIATGKYNTGDGKIVPSAFDEVAKNLERGAKTVREIYYKVKAVVEKS